MGRADGAADTDCDAGAALPLLGEFPDGRAVCSPAVSVSRTATALLQRGNHCGRSAGKPHPFAGNRGVRLGRARWSIRGSRRRAGAGRPRGGVAFPAPIPPQRHRPAELRGSLTAVCGGNRHDLLDRAVPFIRAVSLRGRHVEPQLFGQDHDDPGGGTRPGCCDRLLPLHVPAFG